MPSYSPLSGQRNEGGLHTQLVLCRFNRSAFKTALLNWSPKWSRLIIEHEIMGKTQGGTSSTMAEYAIKKACKVLVGVAQTEVHFLREKFNLYNQFVNSLAVSLFS